MDYGWWTTAGGLQLVNYRWWTTAGGVQLVDYAWWTTVGGRSEALGSRLTSHRPRWLILGLASHQPPLVVDDW